VLKLNSTGASESLNITRALLEEKPASVTVTSVEFVVWPKVKPARTGISQVLLASGDIPIGLPVPAPPSFANTLEFLCEIKAMEFISFSEFLRLLI
jgi:hypothetical protein